MKDKKMILIVDDQAGVRRLMAEALKEEDYDALLAANGLEALEVLKSFQPDLMLLDMKMPGMNGLEVFQELKKYDYKTIVVMMTAYGDMELLTQAKKAGITYFLTKPFDINEMRSMLSKLLDSPQNIKAHA